MRSEKRFLKDVERRFIFNLNYCFDVQTTVDEKYVTIDHRNYAMNAIS